MHILYVLSKEMNLSFADMKDMSFFEILMILDVYKENMEEQKKQNDKENARIERQMSDMQSQYKSQQNMQQQMPKYNPPNFTMPKF